jgi:hypothetical protein
MVERRYLRVGIMHETLRYLRHNHAGAAYHRGFHDSLLWQPKPTLVGLPINTLL